MPDNVAATIYAHLIAERAYLETARAESAKAFMHADAALRLLELRIQQVEKELEAQHGKQN